MHSGSSPKSPLRAQNTSPRRGFCSYLFSMTKLLALFLMLSANPLQKKLISTACICDLILSFTTQSIEPADSHICWLYFLLSLSALFSPQQIGIASTSLPRPHQYVCQSPFPVSSLLWTNLKILKVLHLGQQFVPKKESASQLIHTLHQIWCINMNRTGNKEQLWKGSAPNERDWLIAGNAKPKAKPLLQAVIAYSLRHHQRVLACKRRNKKLLASCLCFGSKVTPFSSRFFQHSVGQAPQQ